LKQCLSDGGTLATLSYPSFYVDRRDLETGLYPKDYLKRADIGLRFVVASARKANRNDLIGNLLRGVSAAGEFEVMLAWALSTYFGEDAVDPYPRISDGSSKTVEFAVSRDGKRLLIEAMILQDDRASGSEKQYCIAQGVPAYIRETSGDQDAARLLRACYDKVHQRAVAEPLFLCVNQCTPWPDPATGAEVAGRLVASEIWARNSTFVGAAFFYAGHLVASAFGEARALAIGAELLLLSELRSALCRLTDSKSPKRARNKAGGNDGTLVRSHSD
jgi:hypothetical protein